MKLEQQNLEREAEAAPVVLDPDARETDWELGREGAAIQREKEAEMAEKIVNMPPLVEQLGSGGATASGSGVRRTLAELSVPSEPGNERRTTEEVAAVGRRLGLSDRTLDRLKTAVAEATMNAMEHGNHYRTGASILVEVLASNDDLSVRIAGEGSGPPAFDAEMPDLEAKLEGMQTPRGWGLFLIKSMVDEMHVTGDENHHTVELILHLDRHPEGGKR